MARSKVKSGSDHDVAHLQPLTNIPTNSVDSRNLKKWGRSPTTAQNVGEGLKILGDGFMIKFKLMKNTFSV